MSTSEHANLFPTSNASGDMHTDHAQLLATKWWSADKFSEHSEYSGTHAFIVLLIHVSGVLSLEGTYRPEEDDRINDAVRIYGEVCDKFILNALSYTMDRSTTLQKTTYKNLYRATLKMLGFGNALVCGAVKCIIHCP